MTEHEAALRLLGDLMNEYEANCPEKYSSSHLIAVCNDFF